MSENKRKLSAKQLLADINAGMTNRELANKHVLTDEQLQTVLQKLTNAGLLDKSRRDETQAVRDDRESISKPAPFAQTDNDQARSSASEKHTGPPTTEPFLLNAVTGLKGEWKAFLSPHSLKLESVSGDYAEEIPVSEADEKLQLMESSIFSPFLILLQPKRTTFKLDRDQLSRLKEWFGPPTPARLRLALKSRFSLCIGMGILFLILSVPLSGDPQSGTQAIAFDPAGFLLGASLLALAIWAKVRPHRILLLLDAVWFCLLAAKVGVTVYQGSSAWWLIVLPLLLSSAFNAFQDYQRLKVEPALPAGSEVVKAVSQE